VKQQACGRRATAGDRELLLVGGGEVELWEGEGITPG